MRLINTHTRKFEEFISNDTPEYAILSHTWHADEVSYGDYVGNRHTAMRGYRKINMTCELAKKAKIRFCWVDTCCIDKSSSAELTEAINSMYRWYQNAQECYAYLEDFTPGADVAVELPKCRWFTRGWTLQELIAPWDVEFFDSAWTSIGHKTNIGNLLSTITGIDEDVLRQQYTLDLVPVAARMSWAARRKTTRPEDMAYCLLGIFNVNLPLLYGEQEKAFQRLQEEIIRSTADLSIFAWWCKKEDNTRDQWALSGVLASSPADFYESGIVKRMHLTDLRDFAFTSVGIRTRLRNLWAAGYGYVLPLNCYSARSGRSLGLRIRKVGREQYLREGPYNLLEYPTGAFEEKRPVERYLLTTLPSLPGVSDRLNRDARFQSAEKLLPLLRLNPVHVKLPQDVEVLEAWPEDRWDDEDRLFFVSGDPRWDSFQLKLRSVIDTKDADGMSVAITFDYVLYALGWSATLGHVMDQTSFGLVSWQQVGNEAEKLLRWAVEEDPSTASLSKRLATVGMPKLQQISFQVPQTLRRLVVAIEGHPKGVDLTIEIIAARDVKAQVPRSWRVFKDY